MRKNVKRNVTLALVLVLVCAAAWLNWSYTNKWGKADSAMARAEDQMTTRAESDFTAVLSQAAEESAPASEYFAQARLTRQESRDAALSLLETAACAESASQEIIDSAMSEITAMANYSMLESQIENELLAKDFADCMVFLSGEGCTIAIPSPVDGLSDAAVARVVEAVLSNTDYEASQVNIIEVKTY